jgi:hypothetical protein
MPRVTKKRRALAAAAAVLLVGAGGDRFEAARTFEAAKVLPAEIRQGPHHRVADLVKADAFYLQFQLTSDFGELDVEGQTLLRTRVAEIDALARLSEVSKGEVFAAAAGGAVLKIGKGVVSAVEDPVATAKGIGGGIKRLGVNLGRKAKRAADSVTKDDRKPEGPERSKERKALDAAGGAANSVFGVNGAARRWAQKLGVDPYSTNPLLHDALVQVGKIDAAGSILTRIALPIPMVISTTATVGGLVWEADPEEVRKVNEGRLAELGVSKEVASRYLINGNYTLTSQARFIAALDAVKSAGCADYVDSASEAEDEREALFFVESAEMLEALHRDDPVTSILPDSRAMVARTATGAVALVPFDWLRWTAALKKAGSEMATRARRELGASHLETRLTGTATPAARAGLAAVGWTLKEGVAVPVGSVVASPD